MLSQISSHIKTVLTNFTEDDSIIFNNSLHKINKENFSTIKPNNHKSITFIDGGQAEIFTTGNFNLSLIRIAAITFQHNEKINQTIKQFYIFTRAKYTNNDLIYESKIFGDKFIDENHLTVSSNEQTIKSGSQRASITAVANVARRFAELALASTISSDFILLDGTLERTFLNEEKYLAKLNNVSALAKSSSLFTISGNSPVMLLNRIGPNNSWRYQINHKTSFVKLNQKARHVFRFEGNNDILPFMINNSTDALFLGYPYGLILADKLARVTNQEKKSLAMQLLLKSDNKDLTSYLHSSNAHEILDNLG
jgi:hypothetical protein